MKPIFIKLTTVGNNREIHLNVASIMGFYNYDVVKVGTPVKPGETFYSDDFWLENTGKRTIYIGKHPNDFEYISKNITNVKGVNIDG